MDKSMFQSFLGCGEERRRGDEEDIVMNKMWEGRPGELLRSAFVLCENKVVFMPYVA